LRHFSRFNELATVADAIKKIAADEIGKEAIQADIAKVVVHVEQDATQTGSFDALWKVEKKDKELHITVCRSWPAHAKDSNNCSLAEDSLAKQIEALL